MTKLYLAVLGGIAAASAAPVAASVDRAPTAHVAYADLDLSQPGDMKVLRHRIAIAVKSVCGDWPSGDMNDMMSYSRCRFSALHSADVQIAAIRSSRLLALSQVPAGPSRR